MKVEKDVTNVEKFCGRKRSKYEKYCKDLISKKVNNYMFTFDTYKEYRSTVVACKYYVKRNYANDVVVFSSSDKNNNEFYMVMMKKEE